jgi:hypothetical protein
MKFLNWKITLVGLFTLLLSGCVEPYFPEVMEAPNSFLVVNGFINGNGTTNIQLLRTQNLKEEGPPPAEINATLRIESEGGERYSLSENGSGHYASEHLNLNPAFKYRLFIRTRGGIEYASDYVQLKVTPAIDAVTWTAKDGEVQFYVSTHDSKNNTRYYRWEYEHTWHYISALTTVLKYENGRVDYRTWTDENIRDCWRSEHSTTIKLGSSVQLSADVISNYKLAAIPYNSEKLSIRNSTLVKQYALTREAYEYWETLKKNTESIGTLFDPLPSQLISNIRGITNPQEPVIGFMTASTMQEKRVFIGSEELPNEWRLFMPYCRTDTLFLSQGNVRDYFEGGYRMPVSEIYGSGMAVIAYTYAPKPCVDCTTRGTNVKPAFWE